jgi:hypothetical protein
MSGFGPAAHRAAGRHAGAGRWRRRRTPATACGYRSCVLRPCAAPSMALVTHGCSIASPFSMPSFCMNPGDPLGGEDAHQVVFQRQVEARDTRVALPTGTAAQLVVDAARFVAFGAEDVQAAGGEHLPHGAPAMPRSDALFPPRRHRPVRSTRLQVTAQHDVGAASGHVGGDGDHARPTGLGDDLLPPAHGTWRSAPCARYRPCESARQVLRGLDGVVPTSTGCARPCSLSMSLMMASNFSSTREVDQVVQVLALHRHDWWG